jgi:hypothetical protein
MRVRQGKVGGRGEWWKREEKHTLGERRGGAIRRDGE